MVCWNLHSTVSVKMVCNCFTKLQHTVKRYSLKKRSVIIGQGFPHNLCPCSKWKSIIPDIICRQISKISLLLESFDRSSIPWCTTCNHGNLINIIPSFFLRSDITFQKKLLICVLHRLDTYLQMLWKPSLWWQLLISLKLPVSYILNQFIQIFVHCFVSAFI